MSQRSSSASITPSLSLDLRAAEHARRTAASASSSSAGEHLDLAERAAGRRRCGRSARRADDRRVRPVRRAERVVHVDVAELGEVGRERGVVRRSRPARTAGSRACITSPGAADATSGSTRGPTTAGASSDLAAEQLAEPRARPAPCEYCGSGVPFGPPEVPAERRRPRRGRAASAIVGSARRDAEVVVDRARRAAAR